MYGQYHKGRMASLAERHPYLYPGQMNITRDSPFLYDVSFYLEVTVL
jgi:hypothetical protein